MTFRRLQPIDEYHARRLDDLCRKMPRQVVADPISIPVTRSEKWQLYGLLVLGIAGFVGATWSLSRMIVMFAQYLKAGQ